MRLKDIYNHSYTGMSKEYEDIFNYKLLSEKKNLVVISKLITKQTGLYPRLHSSIPLLVNEINYESKPKDKVKLL